VTSKQSSGRKKRNQKRERVKAAAEPELKIYVTYIEGIPVRFRGFPPGTKLSEKQLQALRRIALAPQRITQRRPRRPVRYARGILYSGKLDQTWGKPLATAKWLAEELRFNPSVGVRLLEQQVALRWKTPGYLSKMFKDLDNYLQAQQPVFDKLDYTIVDIVDQHPHYTIKQITSALSEQYPERKWNALTRRVQRLLKNVPWHVPR
jgi:hypothetical protein